MTPGTFPHQALRRDRGNSECPRCHIGRLMLRSTTRLKAWRLNSNLPVDSCRRMSSSVFIGWGGATIPEGFVQHNTMREKVWGRGEE